MTGSTRNARTVWTISPHPFAEAHFATFPPELPERCIRAGTSEKGACAACGAPWTRVVEKPEVVQPTPTGWNTGEGRHDTIEGRYKNAALDKQASGRRMVENVASARARGAEHDNPFPTPVTVGWEPGCECGAGVVPCVVLDPFGGAGTTGLVAQRLSRDAVLCELNPAYAAMAEKRIRGDAPLFSDVRT